MAEQRDGLESAKAVLSLVLNLATRVWPDGCGPAGESFEEGWVRKCGGPRPRPPRLALHFYRGGLVVVVRDGQALEIRKLPGSGAAESAVETAVGQVTGLRDRAVEWLDQILGVKR